MLNKYKGWTIERTGNSSYLLTRIVPIEGKTITARARTQDHAKTVIMNEEARIQREWLNDLTYTFKVSFNTTVFDPAIYVFTRGKSAAYEYGNKTSVTLFKDGKFLWVVDTRYDHSVMEDFRKWCIEYLTSNLDPASEPKIEEI